MILLQTGGGSRLPSVGHHQEVTLARVVNLPGLDQGAQGLVHQLQEVLGSGDLPEVCPDAQQDVLHVGQGVRPLEGGQDRADSLGEGGAGALGGSRVWTG